MLGLERDIHGRVSILLPWRTMEIMKSVTLEEAQADLSSLVQQAAAGEVIVIREGDTEVAQIIAPPLLANRKPGGLRGMIRMREDFDDPIPGMEAYESPTVLP